MWLTQARAEQLEPPGDWRVWYLRGGRGAGKTRTGAETFAHWISEDQPGEWAIVAPTFGDARSVCAESRSSGLLAALGAGVKTWNRSEGVIYTAHGAVIYLDGADDGALRIQGKHLRGAWCDEVGLWRDWDRAWNQSIQFAVRAGDPSRIVATGTPKMGHPLVAQLLSSTDVVHSVMRTTDNAANLDPQTIDYLLSEYGGTTLGRQELDGEFIAALEGEILPRHAWRFYDASFPAVDGHARLDDDDALALTRREGRFEQIVHSWDTTWKAKSTSDFVAGQVWGVRGPDRWLLAVYHERASLDAVVEAMLRLRGWTQELWPEVPQRVLIENATWGPEAADVVGRRVDGVHKIRAKGDKVARALAASPALETGHCHLPGEADPDPAGRGYTQRTPARVQAFVEECALFRMDMRHAHDDQVDAWSQMVNWTRRVRTAKARMGRPVARPLQVGSLSGV